MFEDLKAYALVGKTYNEYRERYQNYMKENPREKVSEEDWIISVLITDLLVAQGKLDKSYSERI